MSQHTEIIRKYGIRPKKSFGQNFLVNDGILQKIADAIEVQEKNIVEVGPGYGALTEKLLAWKPKSLTLIELDKEMVAILQERFSSGENEKEVSSGGKAEGSRNTKNGNQPGFFSRKRDQNDEGQQISTILQIFQQDVLDFEPKFKDYSVIANIPYYITSPILYHFLYEVAFRPVEMIILLQKDVGDKIRRVAGNKHSVLSLFIDLACDRVEEICRVSALNFIPAPKVESVVLGFVVKSNFDQEEAKKTLEIIKIGFSEKRKKLVSNLSKGLKISKEGIQEIFSNLGLNENVRAEELSCDIWKDLSKLIGQII